MMLAAVLRAGPGGGADNWEAVAAAAQGFAAIFDRAQVGLGSKTVVAGEHGLHERTIYSREGITVAAQGCALIFHLAEVDKRQCQACCVNETHTIP